MLTVITLYTLDKIFSENEEVKLSSSARQLYTNCLTHHFRDKKPTVQNAMAFDMFISDIPSYHKFEKDFQSLHKAGLIVITDKVIAFQNKWGKHIDRSRLDKASPEEFVAGFVNMEASKFREEILQSESLYELAQMQHKISKNRVVLLLDFFVKEQDTKKKVYSGYTDCIGHFIRWMPFNKEKVPQESVKSTSRILGMGK